MNDSQTLVFLAVLMPVIMGATVRGLGFPLLHPGTLLIIVPIFTVCCMESIRIAFKIVDSWMLEGGFIE